MTAIQDWLFFSATTPGRGAEQRVRDGTAPGTRALDEVTPGPASSSPRDLDALPFRPEGHCARAR